MRPVCDGKPRQRPSGWMRPTPVSGQLLSHFAISWVTSAWHTRARPSTSIGDYPTQDLSLARLAPLSLADHARLGKTPCASSDVADPALSEHRARKYTLGTVASGSFCRVRQCANARTLPADGNSSWRICDDEIAGCPILRD